jgi:hypothetical protein
MQCREAIEQGERIDLEQLLLQLAIVHQTLDHAR